MLTLNNLDCFSSINPEFDHILTAIKTLLDLGATLDKDVVYTLATNESSTPEHAAIIEFN